jgi:hypothetical protein
MTDTPQWNDESMDARLRDLAKEYNRPRGEVPREAMWQAIAPAVRAAGTRVATPVATPDIAPRIDRKRRHIAPYAWTAALAAGLVLGITLEREVLSPRQPAGVAVKNASGDTRRVAATTTSPTAGISGATNESTTGTGPSADATTGTPAGGRVPAVSQRVASGGALPNVDRSARQPPRSDSAAYGSEAGADGQRLYRLAARQTLVQAEALLTSYRASEGQQRDQESMQQAGRWARDVLTSTRLLLDSPAAKDPQFRALFTDLELVLAQIVQLSGAPLQAGERELIERAMRDRDLLPRLRSALPAGATAD